MNALARCRAAWETRDFLLGSIHAERDSFLLECAFEEAIEVGCDQDRDQVRPCEASKQEVVSIGQAVVERYQGVEVVPRGALDFRRNNLRCEPASSGLCEHLDSLQSRGEFRWCRMAAGYCVEGVVAELMPVGQSGRGFEADTCATKNDRPLLAKRTLQCHPVHIVPAKCS